MDVYEFRVYGIPAPQGSKTFYGKGRMAETSKNLPAWRKAIAETLEREFGGITIDYAVGVSAQFFLPRPPSITRQFPSVRPDLDKLQRGLGDGMSVKNANGWSFLKEDSLIVQWHVAKWYADIEEPGAIVSVYRI